MIGPLVAGTARGSSDGDRRWQPCRGRCAEAAVDAGEKNAPTGRPRRCAARDTRRRLGGAQVGIVLERLRDQRLERLANGTVPTTRPEYRGRARGKNAALAPPVSICRGGLRRHPPARVAGNVGRLPGSGSRCWPTAQPASSTRESANERIARLRQTRSGHGRQRRWPHDGARRNGVLRSHTTRRTARDPPDAPATAPRPATLEHATPNCTPYPAAACGQYTVHDTATSGRTRRSASHTACTNTPGRQLPADVAAAALMPMTCHLRLAAACARLSTWRSITK